MHVSLPRSQRFDTSLGMLLSKESIQAMTQLQIIDLSRQPLEIVQKLTRRLDREKIRYCHWKSNEHVDAAVRGQTDLDVLADRAERVKLKQVLGEVGFKQFASVSALKYIDIEDYIAMDEETGTLVHFHLHYQLELGERYLKGYHLPWEELMLSTRIYDREYQIYVADPNLETILLVVRAGLKVRNRDRLTHFLGKNYFQGDILREFRWLEQRIDRAKVKQLSQELLGEAASRIVMDAIAEESHLQKLLLPRNPMRSALKPYRLYHPIVSTSLRWTREVQNIFDKVQSRYLHLPVKTKRVPVSGRGLTIAILGADGAGKSTVTAEIVKGLSKRIDVFQVYLGSGDGPASMLRLPLIWARKIIKAVRSRKTSEQSPTEKTSHSIKNSKLYKLGNLLWAITLVYEKRGKLKQARAARDSGMVIVCDRYPQSQIPEFNEGPLLSHEMGNSSRIFQAIQDWEVKSYQQMAAAMPPDLVIKLNVSPEVALTRKQSLPELIEKKVAAIQALNFPAQTLVINLDADRPLDDVILQAKHAVWENI
jgi:thymidylate kinase